MLMTEPSAATWDAPDVAHCALGGLSKSSLSAVLRRTFSRDVLPGLAAGMGGAAPSLAALAEHCAARLAAGDAETLSRGLTEARQTGVLPEQVCLTLLTDVARRLGEMWDSDRVSFVDVTLGVQQAQRALLDLAPSFTPPMGLRTGRLLLGGAPGEQHGFGTAMVGEFFRHAGWDVALCPLNTQEAWERAAGLEAFDVAGLSLGCGEGMEALAAAIAGIRRASLNRSIAVIVGGPAFIGQPHRAFQIGADATAGDAAQAVRQASALIGSPRRPA